MKRLAFFITALVILPILAHAAEYKFAAPLPGGHSSANTIVDYAKYLFPVLLSIAAGSAFLMFVIGAIEYAASGGNPGRIDSAKGRMTNAILGLLLAIFSVLILQTINPHLLDLQLNLENVGFVDPGDTTAGGGICSGSYWGRCPDRQECIRDTTAGVNKCATKTTTPPAVGCSNDCKPEQQYNCNNKGQACRTCTTSDGKEMTICYYP